MTTSHIPIREVPDHVKKEKIMKPIKLINEAMKLNGVESPRVAVQALNPHAEFGTEEKDEIIPAIEKAKKLGINADGPLPCDTSFITAYKNKNHDCIVGMYHDALQSGLLKTLTNFHQILPKIVLKFLQLIHLILIQ